MNAGDRVRVTSGECEGRYGVVVHPSMGAVRPRLARVELDPEPPCPTCGHEEPWDLIIDRRDLELAENTFWGIEDVRVTGERL